MLSVILGFTYEEAAACLAVSKSCALLGEAKSGCLILIEGGQFIRPSCCWGYFEIYTSLLRMLTRCSLTLSLLKILTKSFKVILRSSFLLSKALGSRACKIFEANLESYDNPSLIKGLIISSASNTPDPSSSQDINKFFANSICFLFEATLFP